MAVMKVDRMVALKVDLSALLVQGLVQGLVV